VRDLNHLVRDTPALHQLDFVPGGFEWIDHQDASRSTLSFLRRGNDEHACTIAVCNFTPAPHRGFRLGVPQPGSYRECLNTDSQHYGGSNVGTPFALAQAEPVACNGRAWSILVNLPPLATVFFTWTP